MSFEALVDQYNNLNNLAKKSLETLGDIFQVSMIAHDIITKVDRIDAETLVEQYYSDKPQRKAKRQKNIAATDEELGEEEQVKAIRQGYSYFVTGNISERKFSRPTQFNLFIFDRNEYASKWDMMVSSIDEKNAVIHYDQINRVLYTAIQSFCCCYDLYKPASRKTPGTFFEMLIGSLVEQVSGIKKGKQIDLPDVSHKVTTDIYLRKTNRDISSLVIPTKITTRERIVQPWAHQRILEKVFGESIYKTALVCVSELQRGKDFKANEICVPNQVGLFQNYLAKLSGIYYADPPLGYLKMEVADLPIRTFDEFFRNDLAILLGRNKKVGE